jgi:hypothetical protein
MPYARSKGALHAEVPWEQRRHLSYDDQTVAHARH